MDFRKLEKSENLQKTRNMDEKNEFPRKQYQNRKNKLERFRNKWKQEFKRIGKKQEKCLNEIGKTRTCLNEMAIPRSQRKHMFQKKGPAAEVVALKINCLSAKSPRTP